jgi:hypothetical protein
MKRLIPFVLALLVSAPALASSRLAITVSEPLRFFFDGAPVSGQLAGNRVVLNSVSPGVHPIEVRTHDGLTVLYNGLVEIPDNSEISARFSRVEGLVVTAGAPPARPVVAGASAAEPVMPAPGASSTGGGSSKSKTAGNAASPDYAGNPEAFGGTIGRAGYLTAATVAPGATAVATYVAPAVANQVSGMVRNAESGGLDALRGNGPGFRQGRPIPPKAKTGTIEFISASNEPYYVFLEGFVIAQFGGAAGAPKKKTTLEVGRHAIEIWDANTMEVRYRGVVQIEHNVGWQLTLTDMTPPESPDRPWMWTAQ